MITNARKVIIQTDTAFDDEGVPVGVTTGSIGIISKDQDEGSRFTQILCHTCVGFCQVGVLTEKLEFVMDQFSIRNRRRCESLHGFNHLLNSWSLSDWMTATVGELGEAANIVKKLNRVRDGIIGNEDSEDVLKQRLADELADTFIYLDLLIQAAGLDVDEIVESKFNRTSQKIGYDGT